MRTLSVRVFLFLFLLACSGAAVAQTPASAPAASPQKEEIIELGKTWPDTPIFVALRSEIEKQWIQRGEFWFTREGKGALRQIRNLSCELSPQTEKTGPSAGSSGQVIAHVQWKEERYYIPKRGKWTLWREGGYMVFEITTGNGKTTAQKQIVRKTRPFPLKRSDTVRPEADEVETTLVKPEMTAEESEALPFFTIPRILSMPRPEYSSEGRAQKINGSVVLTVEVLADGSIGKVSVVRSLGYGLDEKAVKTVRKGKFTPGMELGEPIRAFARVEIHFNIY